MKRFRRLLRGYHPDGEQPQADREAIIQVLMSCIPMLLLFVAINLYYGFVWLATIQSIVVAELFLFLRRAQRGASLPWIHELMMLNCVLVFGAATWAGGIGNLGIYWSLGLPFLAFFINGVRRGWWWIIAYALLITLLFALHAGGLITLPYSHEVTVLVLAMYLFFTMLACVLQLRNEKQTLVQRQLNIQLDDSQRELREVNVNLEHEIWQRTSQLQEINTRLSEEVLEKEKALASMRNSEKKFEHAQRMEAVGTLVGGIAHDFNNMLSGITANLYLLQRHVDSEDGKRRLKTIGELAMHAADMIQQLLTFARKDDVEMKRFDLRLFLHEAYKLATVSIAEHIRCEQDFCRDQLLIEGNATQVQQMLMNLMNNARDALAGRAQPVIRVTLRRVRADAAFLAAHPEASARDYAELSVADTGAGIATGQLAHIFEPFFTTKPAGKGTGLGLAMIYGAMQTHGGVIDVSSRPGVGACFALYFPLCRTPDVDAQDSATQVVRGNGELILLVDDNRELLESNAALLRDLGYTVVTAGNGLEAVRIYCERSDQIRLVLMDVVMPVLGGAVAANRIWAVNEHARIIFVSGYDRDHDMTCELMPQGQRMLNKPLDIGEMSRAIADAMAE